MKISNKMLNAEWDISSNVIIYVPWNVLGYSIFFHFSSLDSDLFNLCREKKRKKGQEN